MPTKSQLHLLTLIALIFGNHCFAQSDPQAADSKWISLTERWEPALFGGEGEVTVKEGVIEMLYGDPITGVSWTGPIDPIKKPMRLERQASEPSKSAADSAEAVRLPRDRYELRWECCRDDGYDFLCAFTFPVGEGYTSLVMGGWGGGTTGLSCIDGDDASSNDSTKYIAFQNDRWYGVRVRVSAKQIVVWIDDKEVIKQGREGHEFDVRGEVEACKPFGIANFQCDSRIRNVQIRRLSKQASLK
ncbi:MAG: hypothetical protein AAF802_08090 [Planctomycetota bacterium]